MQLPYFNTPARRRRAHAQARAGIMRELLGAAWPAAATDWRELSLVALDFETTGLNAKRDRLLSYGLVKIEGGAIRLASARHQIIQARCALDEKSVTLHQITDDASAQGAALSDCLPELLQNLCGCVVLAHFAKIEKSFLNHACNSIYQSPCLLPFIDTMQIALRLQATATDNHNINRLRLYHLRSDYRLPEYPPHNALYDALSTAELFLAQAAQMERNHQPLTFGQLQ